MDTKPKFSFEDDDDESADEEKRRKILKIKNYTCV